MEPRRREPEGPGEASSLVAQAYAALKIAIRESEFPPGTQISAQEIALRLGMSRTPIHEAALKLQQEGLVRIVPKRGILVCALAPEDIGEIYEVIIAIEASAAERAAGLDAAERGMLADMLDTATDDMAAALSAGDFTAWGKADERFHGALVERCGNSRFASIMHTVNDQSHRVRMLTLRIRPSLAVSIEDHRAIAAGIRAGDPAAAREAARGHRAKTREELLPLIRQFGFRHL